MKNSIALKDKIAGKIIILNKYILMILLERRENPSNLACLFDKKVFLTSMFEKSAPLRGGEDSSEINKLKDKISTILSTDESVTELLFSVKDRIGKEIAELSNVSRALTAYSSEGGGGKV